MDFLESRPIVEVPLPACNLVRKTMVKIRALFDILFPVPQLLFFFLGGGGLVRYSSVHSSHGRERGGGGEGVSEIFISSFISRSGERERGGRG